MTTPTSNGRRLLRTYRAAADRITDPEKRSEYLRNIRMLENAPAPGELRQRIKKERSMALVSAFRRGLVGEGLQIPRPLARVASFFFFVSITSFVLSWVPGLGVERTHLYGAFILFLGLGSFIVSACKLRYKTPLSRREINSYIHYDKNPIKYLATVLFLLALSAGMILIGVYWLA